MVIDYFSANKFDTALIWLKKILQENPEYLAAYYQTGKCYEELQKFEDAKAIYQKGIELATKHQKTKTLNELREALFLLEDD